MTTKADEYLAALTEEDALTLTEALTAWRNAGNDKPRIPIGEDLDGDGLTDSWGLSKEGKLVVVPTRLSKTVYEATGDGEEGGERS